MNTKLILFTARAVALFLLAAAITIGLRKVLAFWHITVHSLVFALLDATVILSALPFAMKPLLKELTGNLGERRPTTVVGGVSADHEAGKVYKFPGYLASAFVVLGIAFLGTFYLTKKPGIELLPIAYVVPFSIAFVFFAVAYYMFRYSVTIENNHIVIDGVGHQEVNFDNIVGARIGSSKLSKVLTLQLISGKKIVFYGFLKDFSELCSLFDRKI